MARPDENKYMDRRLLVRIYKKFRREPLKTFVLGDFFQSQNPRFRRYLNTLISLGLIEKVNAVYQFGRGYKIRKSVIGYRYLIK